MKTQVQVHLLLVALPVPPLLPALLALLVPPRPLVLLALLALPVPPVPPRPRACNFASICGCFMLCRFAI